MAKIVREILNPPLGETGLHQVRDNLGRLANETRWQIPPVVKALLAELDDMASEEKRGADWSVKYAVPAGGRLHGTLVDHPVWAALYADNRNSTLVRQLQSLLLESLDDQHAKLLPHDIAAAGLLIRVLSLATGEDGMYYDDLLSAVAVCNASSSQRANASRFIRVALGMRVTRRERGSVSDVTRVSDGRNGTRRDQYGEVHVLVPADPDDPAELPEVSEFVAHKKTTSSGSQEVSQGGIDPCEDQPGNQLLLLVEAVRASSIEHKIARRQSRTARDILARANAALPITYQQLTDAELHALANYIRDRSYCGGTDKQCVQMALSIMLYTSSSLDDVINMVEDADEAGLKFDWKENQFRIPRITPNYATKYAGVENLITSSAISNDGYVCIPNLYIRIGSLEKFRKELIIKKREQFSAYLKRELKSLSDRITVHKIQRCAYEIARTHYDPVIAQTTFGLRISSANVQQYYSAVSDVQVIHCYTMATREMRRRMGIMTSNAIPSTHQPASWFYSARNMPTDTCVKNMILLLSIDAFSSDRGTHQWHNANTLLCIMVQGLLTTIRGVYDPFVSVENSSLALFFRDKDRADFSHSRYQFVHPMAVLVSDYYQSIRRHTMNANSIEYEESIIFLLDENCKVIIPRPKNISVLMKYYWTYPLNSLRKYVRRKLVEYGISYESTNMLMNHHSVGESSWDSYSTDDPLEMKAEIMAFYDRIISCLGIRQEWFNVV